MADRSVRVRLRAEVSDFNRSMADATKTVDKMSASFDAQGQKIQTVSGRMVRSAEVNREAWNSTGLVLAGVAAGFGAVAVSVARTGIEYNTLQQTSRAALSTMLGGAVAANEQMDKLDEWARNSPFAKQVFINAQRQMLGFGIEAEKVLPYLDAIQNAVAAMGGSNQQISEISTVLAKIASQGKITARELMQLGIHGIDAATLIGSQMDMTGGQIRESITAGSIDAMTALDALTNGMQERFGGAAENVKNTYAGAIDRVKAAWRDLSSDLMEPLISAHGGGMLVDLANQAADAMRAFQALPEPVKNTVVALTGLTGVTIGGAAAFLLIFPRVMDVVKSMKQLERISPRVATGLRNVGKAAGFATALFALSQGFTALSKASVESLDGTATVSAQLLDIAEGVSLADTEFAKLFTNDYWGKWRAQWTGGHIEDIRGALDAIGGEGAHGLNNAGWSLLTLGQSASGAKGQAQELFSSIDEGLASLVQSGSAEHAAAALAALADEGGVSVEYLIGLMPQYRDALTAVDNETRLAAESTEGLAAEEERLAHVQERSAEAQEGLTKAREAYRDEVDRWRSSMAGAFTSHVTGQGAYEAAVQKSTEAAQRQAQAANEASAEWARQQEGDVKTVTKTWEDFYDGVTVSARAFIDELKEQVDAQSEWAGNITSVSERLAESFSGKDLTAARAQLDALAASGPAGAGTVATLAGATDAELAEIVALWGAGGTDASRAFVDAFQQSSDPFLEPRLDLQRAQDTLDHWAAQTVTLEVDVEPTRTGLIGGWVDRHMNAINDGRSGNRTSGWATPYYLPQGVTGYASGGPIAGPGTSTSDSIPIMASNNEYMHSAAAHGFWGTRAMEHMNNMNVAGLWAELGARGFRDGGAVTATPAPQVVTVPVTQTYESHAPISVTAYGSDIAGIEAEAERRRRNDLGGR